MKAKILLTAIFIFLLSCSTNKDNIVKTGTVDEYSMIGEVENLILKYKFEKDVLSLKDASRKIDDLLIKGSYEKQFAVMIFSLQGQIEYFRGDTASAGQYLEKADRLYVEDERLYILKSMLAKDKESVLKQGIVNCSEKDKLKIQLAELYLSRGQYRDAAVLFDEALINLGQEYKKYYSGMRDESFARSGTGNSSTLNAAKYSLTFSDGIEIILKNTDYLQKIEASVKKDVIFKKLKSLGYVYNSELKLSDNLKRKDAAVLIFYLYAESKNDPELIVKYKSEFNPNIPENEKYRLRGKSPIPDIEMYDYYYFPTLFLVEHDIMNLPDGERFYPELILKSDELVKILNRIK